MRYKLTIEYDGTNLLGWQEQLDGPSVQDYLQRALSCFTPLEETNEALLANEEYEDEGTGEHLQKSNSNLSNNDFSEAYGGASTERSPAAYNDVREDASTGERLQKSNKIVVYGAGRTDRLGGSDRDLRALLRPGRISCRKTQEGEKVSLGNAPGSGLFCDPLRCIRCAERTRRAGLGAPDHDHGHLRGIGHGRRDAGVSCLAEA